MPFVCKSIIAVGGVAFIFRTRSFVVVTYDFPPVLPFRVQLPAFKFTVWVLIVRLPTVLMSLEISSGCVATIDVSFTYKILTPSESLIYTGFNADS